MSHMKRLIINQEEDMMNAHCRRHYTGGRAFPINCVECQAEARAELAYEEYIYGDDD